MADMLDKTKNSKKKAEKLSDSEDEFEEEFKEIKKELKQCPASPEVKDWTNARVLNCGFDINKSTILDDEEKITVKELMVAYVGGAEADELAVLHYELAYLLNKAFVAPFDIQILRNFTKALQVNDDLTSLPSFSLFAAWWNIRDSCTRSSSENSSSSGWGSRSLVVRPAPTAKTL
ncbi:hypothetical protein KCU65_g9256, partial [Aureobasidium melanogenum]